MKCKKCGAEYGEDVKFCTQCGAPMGDEGQDSQAGTEPAMDAQADGEAEAGTISAEAQAPEEGQPEAAEAVTEPAEEAGTEPSPAEPSVKAEEPKADGPMSVPVPASGEPEPNKKFLKILFAVIAVLAVIAVAAVAYVKMNAKDPKQVVIDAFEKVYTEGQVFPSEELFGFKDFSEAALKADMESGLTLKMDSCSDPDVNQFAGSGLRLEGRSDKTNGKSSFNMGVIYNGMDLANLDAYYGEDTLMMAVPELSGRVFTLDLGEGLGERIKNSPTVGPLLAENGVDVDGLAGYFTDLIDEAEKAEEEGKAPFDIEALLTRYREGSNAQENFKAAMTVEKADKGTYTMNGAQVSCQGYDVTISKDSMIEFLRTSSDFFLQDETLKADYLKQLEATVRMSELMGSAMTGMGSMSAEQMQEQAYDEVKDAVDEMITYLDKSLTDIQMTVYVDKDGNLAALEGSTNLYVDDSLAEEEGYVAVTFNLTLEGGAYLTQNVKGNITLEDADDTVKVDLSKQGTYDGKMLTCDLSVDVTAPDASVYNFMYTGTYDSNDGSYHAAVELGGEGSQLFKMSATGIVDQMEKGKAYHMDIDALEIAAMDNSMNMVLSGELYSRPLSAEVTPLDGEPMDILSATEEDWNNVLMEMVFGIIGLSGQLEVPMG
ncbi:zinc-ribbon domain-containing protein [Lachnoclostridium pacaense]|uniref:zinc ribbon domain-containing protein n=1 Tax=Enterocloster hominis (ex Hitch et al. 2024) TaxID=1917870 RepID=UPI001D11E13C|nr:zinc ribbon domain-containing protein [Lachnoclostridium pacaense]MCC2819998.1 zinc-ribbon domain-containing protein [Lachnoclostridium pacaense]